VSRDVLRVRASGGVWADVLRDAENAAEPSAPEWKPDTSGPASFVAAVAPDTVPDPVPVPTPDPRLEARVAALERVVEQLSRDLTDARGQFVRWEELAAKVQHLEQQPVPLPKLRVVAADPATETDIPPVSTSKDLGHAHELRLKVVPE
jgi:hypothetical protein